MHLNTRNNDQLLFQDLPVGTNSYGRHAFSYTAHTVQNKLPYKIHNAPSVILKHLPKPIFIYLAVSKSNKLLNQTRHRLQLVLEKF